METFIIYIAKVAVCLGIFLSVYVIFLRKTTFFRLNRFFLLSGFAVSLILPLVTPTYDVIISVPAVSVSYSAMPLEVAEDSNIIFDIWTILTIVYSIGVLLFLMRNIVSYLKIFNLIQRGKRIPGDKFITVENLSVKSAFTVLNYVVINSTNLRACLNFIELL